MCGLVGIASKEEYISRLLYLGLHQLEHRGQESAGATTQTKNGEIMFAGRMGKVSDPRVGELITTLPGTIGIGHTRYGTAGESSPLNMQPTVGKARFGEFALAQNGNLVNTEILRQITRSHPNASDTRVITDLLSLSLRGTLEEALGDVLPKLEGAFCLLILFNNKIYAVRDAFGIHPLQLGQSDDGYVVASESCVFDRIGAKFIRDIPPGDLIVIDRNDWLPYTWAKNRNLKLDIFELIYYSRPDSVIERIPVWKARLNMGKHLAREYRTDADLIVCMPDSGKIAYYGYIQEMLTQGYKTPNYDFFNPDAIFRPHTTIMDRSFLKPTQDEREKLVVSGKFNLLPGAFKGKDVMVIDDSIVRGTTSGTKTKQLLHAGAQSVSFGSASPPILYYDYYGSADTGREKDRLIAREYGGDVTLIAQEIGARSVGYLSLEKTIQAALDAREDDSTFTAENFYTGQFTGEYPAGLGDFAQKKDT